MARKRGKFDPRRVDEVLSTASIDSVTEVQFFWDHRDVPTRVEIDRRTFDEHVMPFVRFMTKHFWRSRSHRQPQQNIRSSLFAWIERNVDYHVTNDADTRDFWCECEPPDGLESDMDHEITRIYFRVVSSPVLLLDY